MKLMTQRLGLAALLGLLVATPASAAVTWMDLLETPDDVALNRQFISERIEAGDVPAALSAVERLINLRPADIQLRLLRAELLVNLGNDTLAIGEIEALARLPMPPEQSARVDELREVIESRARRWRTIVSTSVGLSGSDNANSYPSSGLLEFRPTGATENSTSTYETFGGAEKTIREVATNASVSVAATYEFANQDRDSATIGAAHSNARGRKYEYLTNSSSTVFAGASLRLGTVTLSPSLRASETLAKTAADTNTTGGGLSVTYTLPGSLQSYAAANYNIINKVSSAAFTTADQNDGHSRTYRAGLSRRLGEYFTIFAEANRTTFNPTESRRTPGTNAYLQLLANASTTNGGSVGLTVSPTQFSRVTASVASSKTRYPNIEPTSQKYRHDTQTRQSLGMQISGAAFSPDLGGMMMSLNASTTRNDSNILQYDYKRSDVSLNVSYQMTP